MLEIQNVFEFVAENVQGRKIFIFFFNVKVKKLVFIFQTIFCHRGGCYVTTTRTILPIRLGNTVDNFPL